MKNNFVAGLLMFLVFWITPVFNSVQAQTVPPKITTRLLLNGYKVRSGRTLRATVSLEIPPGYHVNAHDPKSRYAVPTRVEVKAPQRLKIGPVAYPKGFVRRLSFTDDQLSLYENRVVMRFTILVPPTQRPGQHEISVRVSYQSCSDQVCFPPAKSEISTTFSVE